MGSSVVQHGWQNYGWSGYGGGIREMPSFAAPWNLSRERSFDRLRQEAQFAGADAVIGIEMTAKGFLGDPGNVEYVVFGTAVRETTLARRAAVRAADVRALRPGRRQAAPDRSRDAGRDRPHLGRVRRARACGPTR